MYLMYVDESGDPGMVNSPTQYFILSGLIIHELKWNESLDELIQFKKRMYGSFNLRFHEEIHASAFISRPKNLVRIKRHQRLTILRLFADQLASMNYLNIINIVIDKSSKPADYDAFDMAWKALIQRFENTIDHRNFNGPQNPEDKGIIFPDNTDDKKLMQLVRRMRRFNPIPHQKRYGPGARNRTLNYIIEDPNFRNSEHSFFIQAADLIAYLLLQKVNPNGYMKKKSGNNYFNRLNNILCKTASSTDPQGIVYL